MEVDTICVVKGPRDSTLPMKFIVERMLQHDAARWRKELHALAKERGVTLCNRHYRWEDVDITEEMPTDLLVYFLYALEPHIAPSVQKVICDGRVHLILILSYRGISLREDWHRNIAGIPLRAKVSGNILIPDSENMAASLIDVHVRELGEYSRADMHRLLTRVIRRKEQFGD